MQLKKMTMLIVILFILITLVWLFYTPSQLSAPYGLWKSPITEHQVIQAAVGYETMKIDPAHPEILYLSSVNPSKQGRSTITRFQNGSAKDCLPKKYSARSTVNAYGGGEFTVYDNAIYFSNLADQRLYRVAACGESPVALTPAGDSRYADCSIDAVHQQLYCVREGGEGSAVEKNIKVAQSIVRINIKTGEIAEVATGHDFYASPKINPAGNQLAWITWDYPNMPWNKSVLWLAHIDKQGHFSKPAVVMNKAEVSVFQPQWSPAGVLYFIADQTGWWNFYRYNNKKVESAYLDKHEFGLATSNLGMSTYGFINEDTLAATYMHEGRGYLGTIDLKTKKLTKIDLPFTEYANIISNASGIYFFAGSPSAHVSVMHWDRGTQKIIPINSAPAITVNPKLIAIPKHLKYTSMDGQIARANFYPPTNPLYEQYMHTTNEKPPLIVLVHGGPINRANTVLDFEKLFWTSRGYAILDVDYRGSTGYGRDYRNVLQGQWGIIDTEDVVAGAQTVAAQGWVDAKRMIIKGESAGGYTVLRALSTQKVFAGGVDYFGWSNLETARLHTDRFEAHYLDGLVGLYDEKLYRARSPFFDADKIEKPLLIFQGLKDRVVDPRQSKMMFQVVKSHGKPVAYITFKNEGHGFGRADTLMHCLKAEQYFYQTLFNLSASPVKPADPVDGSIKSVWSLN